MCDPLSKNKSRSYLWIHSFSGKTGSLPSKIHNNCRRYDNLKLREYLKNIKNRGLRCTLPHSALVFSGALSTILYRNLFRSTICRKMLAWESLMKKSLKVCVVRLHKMILFYSQINKTVILFPWCKKY